MYRTPRDLARHWAAKLELGYGRRRKDLGRWKTETAAAEAYDRAVLHYAPELRRNFPRKKLEPATAKQLRAETWGEYKQTTTSQYRGVSFYKRDGSWTAAITHERRRHYLGRYRTEEEAAEAYDRAARRLKGTKARVNFPTR